MAALLGGLRGANKLGCAWVHKDQRTAALQRAEQIAPGGGEQLVPAAGREAHARIGGHVREGAHVNLLDALEHRDVLRVGGPADVGMTRRRAAPVEGTYGPRRRELPDI